MALPDRYDDGGYTGANMERPALKKLLQDVRDGLVDCVMVYKVDRLTRSLLDFAWIMEVLRQHGVSFVSVTRQFNTTGSLGRLTLKTRQLNRYINLPTEWTSKPTSGFDTFMIEGFQYAGLDRSIDKVRAMAGYPFEILNWPRTDCRYLTGHFQHRLAVAAGLPSRAASTHPARETLGLRPPLPVLPPSATASRSTHPSRLMPSSIHRETAALALGALPRFTGAT